MKGVLSRRTQRMVHVTTIFPTKWTPPPSSLWINRVVCWSLSFKEEWKFSRLIHSIICQCFKLNVFLGVPVPKLFCSFSCVECLVLHAPYLYTQAEGQVIINKSMATLGAADDHGRVVCECWKCERWTVVKALVETVLQNLYFLNLPGLSCSNWLFCTTLMNPLLFPQFI